MIHPFIRNRLSAPAGTLLMLLAGCAVPVAPEPPPAATPVPAVRAGVAPDAVVPAQVPQPVAAAAVARAQAELCTDIEADLNDPARAVRLRRAAREEAEGGSGLGAVGTVAQAALGLWCPFRSWAWWRIW